MENKYKKIIQKIQEVFKHKKIIGDDFPVAKHWRMILVFVLLVGLVFVGIGVYVYFTLELMREKALSEEVHQIQTAIPNKDGVKYIVDQYRAKENSFIETVSVPPQPFDLGLMESEIEEDGSAEDGTEDEGNVTEEVTESGLETTE